MKVQINCKDYILLEDDNNVFDIDEVSKLFTEYFEYFDYIIGDFSYSKLRLKGFCKKGNINYKEINDFSIKDKYLKEKCAYECKYFILENLNPINEILKEDL